MGRGLPPARSGERHLRRDLHPRDGQPEARHDRIHRNPQPARVQPAALAISQSPRVGLAHPDRPGAREDLRLAVRAHREGLRRPALRHARPVGHRVDLRRSGREAEPLAPDLPGACGAGLGRAAAARLLGNRAHQRAAHRGKGLGHAKGDGRLMGRRDGPHPVDAGGLAQRRHRLRWRWQGQPARQAGRCARQQREVSRQSRKVSARRALGLRGPRGRPRLGRDVAQL